MQSGSFLRCIHLHSPPFSPNPPRRRRRRPAATASAAHWRTPHYVGQAATMYYQLSQLSNRTFGALTVSEEELYTALTMAAKCAILAPAGPRRSRLLGVRHLSPLTCSVVLLHMPTITCGRGVSLKVRRQEGKHHCLCGTQALCTRTSDPRAHPTTRYWRRCTWIDCCGAGRLSLPKTQCRRWPPPAPHRGQTRWLRNVQLKAGSLLALGVLALHTRWLIVVCTLLCPPVFWMSIPHVAGWMRLKLLRRRFPIIRRPSWGMVLR